MKTIKNWLLSGLLFMLVTSVFSQGKITGTITDGGSNGSLPGVNVIVKGTTIGTTTDFDGKFVINSTVATGELVITYVGFGAKAVKFSVQNGATVNLGTIALSGDENLLSEIIVKSGVVDLAKDRKTPVAVSTIKAAEIKEKLGNQEFPEMLNNTPSVYATKSGGGFGDARVNIRGFDQRNIAVMINGVPVNDMENSAVYWSNWAGLSDVTSAMQVQRGLGSSKLAISSVGGTINVVTKTADLKEGGTVSSMVANDNFLKTLATYSTGKMENGLSASVLLSQTFGNGYVDGTKFAAANYFIGVGYELNDKHDFQLTFTGAPQWHNQRSTASTIAQYVNYGNGIDEPNIKYNADWGYLDGKEYSFRTNFYHKPIASLNWDFKINETTKLATVVYGSWGRGGGSNGTGGIRGKRFNDASLRNANGEINVDLINAWNSGQMVNIGGVNYTRTLTNGDYQNSSSTGSTTNLSTGISKIASINSHNWYGGVMNLNKKLSEQLTLDFGVDARAYRGIHYQNITDLLGADNFLDNRDINNPGRVLTFEHAAQPHLNPFFNSDYQQAITYKNDGLVRWYGAFSQLEYSTEKLTAFVQGAVSQQGFRRDDFFKYLTTDPLYSTDYENILGGNIKGGVNYNIDANHNVFVNSGYYSKQPFFNAVYPNNASIVNGNLTNEKVTAFEAGYGFRSSVFNVNLNVYHTSWADRYQRLADASQDNLGGYYDFTGIKEVHSGVELDMNARVMDKLKLNGMFSIGNWVYEGNSISNRFDNANNPIEGGTSTTLYLDGVKVGDAAQMTASFGATYEIVKRVSIDANYRFVDNLFAAISPGNFSKEDNKGSLELPSFGLLDAGFSYKMLVGKNKSDAVNFRFNMNNVLDKIYIAESRTNIFADDFVSGTAGPTYESAGKLYDGIATSNQVFFGFGRTWNVSLSYDF